MEDLVISLSRWQFAITTVYHFFFVPLTIGLGVLVAILETIYVRTNKEIYKEMTKFWGKLFAINFAMGVVTGIVQEFQFGMNWSEYSRYVGDIFGAPLAIEALLAFFVESTFLGVWLFGWDKLPKKIHLFSIWIVAFGAIISAFWILVANSFMQAPIGFVEENGRLIMNDFGALITNPNVWVQFPHTLFSGFTTGATFIAGVSAYHLFKKQREEFFTKSLRLSVLFGFLSVFLVVLVGHTQGQEMVKTQPMKMAAAEALWDSEDPASFSLFSIVDEKNKRDILSFRIPGVLSLLSYNQFSGRVEGINQLQARYEQLYGPGNYIPPITISYWSFRIMVGTGFLILFIFALLLYFIIRNKNPFQYKWSKFLPFAIVLPFLANSFGWILTEMGRQPWVVFGYLKTADAISKNVTVGMVLISLIGFSLVYASLIGADIFLLQKFAKDIGQPGLDTSEPMDFWEKGE
ncbi:MAG: cytochrome ubiquinol oxidase subunit I [Chloroflexi bacterium 44-23]|nr:MAG: cytochrome ubiquinol oxidase subunit I [Chloroflexi bacterium 44-23]